MPKRPWQTLILKDAPNKELAEQFINFMCSEEIAAEKGVSVEDIFILYMDLASEASVEAENQLQATLDEDEAADFSRIANRLS